MAHYIVTRFNLREKDVATNKALDVKWLEARFELFDRFCWPSILGQTQQNFKWLVLFDADTPDVIRERVEKYAASYGNFTPIYFPPFTEFSGRMAVIRALGGEIPNVLITTRLDNDDGISLDYVEQVQRYSDVTVPTVIEFPVGYIWCNDRIYIDRQPHNAFVSLVEPLNAGKMENFTTVYSGSHTNVGRLGKVEIASNRPGWLQVIHGGNLENRHRGIRCSMRNLADRFSVDHTLLADRENAIFLELDRVRTGIIFFINETLRAIKRRVTRAYRTRQSV